MVETSRDRIALAKHFAAHSGIDDQCDRVVVNLGYVSLAERDLIVAALRSPANETAGLREALVKLLLTAKLLQQNSEGCAFNHHGLDFEQQGLPGWLRDTQKDIDAAKAALATAQQGQESEEEYNPAFVEEIKRAAALPPEATFNNAEDALKYLDAATPAVAVRQASADDIRGLGWAVAVHNDYRQSNEPHTFWLFTKDGQAIKGEGRTDAEALNQVRAALTTAQQGQESPLLQARKAGDEPWIDIFPAQVEWMSREGYLLRAIEAAANAPAVALREALRAFLTAYGSQDSGTEGLDKAATLARSALALPASARVEDRDTIVEECVNAARDGFEAAMQDYVLIGPSGMAMRMINSIKALAPKRATPENKGDRQP